jgi:hypothetical protein
VPEDDNAVAEFLSRCVEAGENVFVSPGPSSAGFADAAVLETGCRDAFARECCTKMTRVMKVVPSAPEAAVNHDGGAAGFVRRKEEIEKL